MLYTYASTDSCITRGIAYKNGDCVKMEAVF